MLVPLETGELGVHLLMLLYEDPSEISTSSHMRILFSHNSMTTSSFSHLELEPIRLSLIHVITPGNNLMMFSTSVP